MSICDKCKRESECPVAHEDDFCLNYVRKPQTNADRIRSMTDEELAKELSIIGDCRCPNGSDYCTEGGCQKCWLDWLRQEEN